VGDHFLCRHDGTARFSLMKRIAASLIILFALGLVGCTDETKPHLPDYDPDASRLGPGAFPPGSIPGGGGAGTTGSADAGTDSEDVSLDPDTVPDSGDQ
jgi:hypothetical protein